MSQDRLIIIVARLIILYQTGFVNYNSAEITEKYSKIKLVDLSHCQVINNVPTILGLTDIFDYDSPDNVWNSNKIQLDLLKIEIGQHLMTYVIENNMPVNDFLWDWDGWFVTHSGSNTHLIKHSHAEHADICLLYYLYVDPEASEPGFLEIFSAEDTVDSCALPVEIVRPSSGLLVIFPGGAPHKVRPYGCARFAIATNIKFVE